MISSTFIINIAYIEIPPHIKSGMWGNTLYEMIVVYSAIKEIISSKK